MTQLYNQSMLQIIDDVAPKQVKMVVVREAVPWYDGSLKTLKAQLRKAETSRVKSRYPVCHDYFKHLGTHYNQQLHVRRSETISQKIAECGVDQSKLYYLINKLTGRVKSNPLPEGDDQS